jgi:hypothetical protein
VTVYQKLSASFIREFSEKVDWHLISKYQPLSESFIREFKDSVIWYDIAKYQKLSSSFRKEFGIEIPKNSWLYTSSSKKLKYIKENTNYEVLNDKYIIAYKSVQYNYYSTFNFQYKYEVGKTYQSHCDCDLTNKLSFGLSAWGKKEAQVYCNDGRMLKVQIPISKIGAIVDGNNKIRCFKLRVIEEAK